MNKGNGRHDDRRTAPALASHDAVVDAEDESLAHEFVDEPTRALPQDGRGNPLLLANLLNATRKPAASAPPPVVAQVTSALGKAESSHNRPTPRHQGVVQSFVAEEPSQQELLAPPTDGAPYAEIPPLTSAELSLVFPPEMREPVAGATLRALEEAQAAAPSRVTGENAEFSDFSREVDVTRGPTRIGKLLDETATAPLTEGAAERVRVRSARDRERVYIVGFLAAAAAAGVTVALYLGLFA